MSGLETISPLAGRDGAPAFDEPWQAQVLGLAYALVDAGVFSAGSWLEALGTELRKAAARGAPDNHANYYQAALIALERLTATADGGVSGCELATRIDAWRRAYENTPHGQPVELGAGGRRKLRRYREAGC